MTESTEFLNKLTCAARTAHDCGYAHTGRVLAQMVAEEKMRLKDGHLNSMPTLDSDRESYG